MRPVPPVSRYGVIELTTIIDGKALAGEVEAETLERAKKLANKAIVPGLATVLVGENPASQMYIRLKHSACSRAGIRSENVLLPESSTEEEIIAKIEELNLREDINGILLQLPLPGGLNPQRAMMSILPEKDVDGFHPRNMGALLLGAERLVPCTPLGIIYALERLDKKLEGTEVVIVGHSNVVGKPLAAMMLNRNATVQVCHVFTRDLAEHTRDADILVVAAGVPGLIKKEMVRPGAYIFDVGINRVGDKTVGDVDYEEVSQIAGAITPVPGGVGPLTVAMLLRQTLNATEDQTKDQQ
ncbi:MAG: bifunctional methylenetetrahydrofolate dehydrogenase/methenyltetrahydrofolate cyclohydrolase [Methanothrix soehngenii]|uniref:Bifunctional protein FolD n=2 Tax=Methanothrix TaxID=2222 RepID=A0A7K4AIY6_METSH|nr:bifunctional methylenetetrahydrofolate dehydrogenase/methenyltetrahydrofolate cyclohydrolase [Methanothrix soehngenii]